MNGNKKYRVGFGERLRAVRKRAKLGQLELANQLGVSRQSVSGYETERLRPSLGILEKVCDLYEVHPSWLLYGVASSAAGLQAAGSATGITSAPIGGEQLTHSQQSLMKYIQSDKEAAEKLARLLWNKALDL